MNNFISTDALDLLNQITLNNANWKWLTIAVTFIVMYFLRKLIRWIIFKVKKSQTYFNNNIFFEHFLNHPIEKGFSWVIVCVLSIIIFDAIELSAGLSKYLIILAKLFLSVNLIRITYLAAEALGEVIQDWAKKSKSDFDGQLAPFLIKTIKVLVIIIGALVLLQDIGVNVTALLAGLGIGGMALAFAAQDTVANVFGTITILLDKPFKLGDAVKVGDTEGTIEELGFRSTRIRTPYNSLITVPNAAMAKERIDNLTARNGLIRFKQNLMFSYQSSESALQQFCEETRQQLALDPTVDKTRVSVGVNNCTDSQIIVLVLFHFKPDITNSEIIKTHQFLNLILQIAKKHNLTFTQTSKVITN